MLGPESPVAQPSVRLVKGPQQIKSTSGDAIGSKIESDMNMVISPATPTCI